jgi:hypothetical protein
MGFFSRMADMLTSVVTRRGDATLFNWISEVSKLLDGDAMQQRTWYIDPLTGNDGNNGITSTTALKTDAERQRRMGFLPVWSNGTYHLFYLNDLPASDPFVLQGFRMANAFIFVHGNSVAGNGKTSLFTGTLDGLVVRNRTSTPQHSWELTCNALATTWLDAGLVSARLRLTSGSNAGATSWPMLDLGAKAAKCCNFITKLGDAPNTSLPIAEITPAIGDSFVVEELTQMANGVVNLTSFENGSFNTSGQIGVCFESLNLGTVNWQNRSKDRVAYYGCVTRCEGANKGNQTVTCDAVFFISCKCTGASQFLVPSRGIYAFYGGYANILMTFDSGAIAEFNRDFMVQGNRITAVGVGAQISANGLAVFGSSGPAIRFDGVFRMVVLGPLWGDGNVGVGLAVGSNEIHLASGFSLANLTMTGADGDFSLGGLTNVRAFDDTLPGWTSPRSTTWANLALAVAGGGFGGQVMHQPSGGRIVQNFTG